MFAGAAFTDAADISDVNADAVELLSALNIIQGDPDGSFAPEREVTRAEMAKMIYTIRNGGNDDASAYETVTTSFTDISGHWAEGYIKYLQNTGIVAGKSAYIFDPDSTVTTGEAMKMALVLAGYDEKNAGLTGINWATNTLTYATTYGLTDNVASAMTAGCARQDAAQILANCLGMTAVRYSSIVEDFVNDSKNGLSWGGDPISVGYKWMDLYTNVGTLIRIKGDELELLYTDADRTDSDDADIKKFINIDTDYSDLMGQKVKVLFADGKNNAVIGVYAIPDNSTVVVNQKEIGTDGDRVSFGGESYALESEGATVYIDGQKQSDTMRANYFKQPQSANVVTFIDIDDDGRFDAASIKTVNVAKVSYVSSTQIIAGNKTYRFADDNIAEDVAKDDWVMVTRNLFNDNNDIVVVEPVTGTVNAVKTGTTYYEYQIGDEWYNEGPSARSNNNIKGNVRAGVDVEAIVVNGIVFAAEKTSGEAGKLNDILFVAYIENRGLNTKTAAVMYPDGTQDTIKLDSMNTDDTGATIQAGAFYEYSKSGNVYKLSTIDPADDAYGDFTNIDTNANAVSKSSSTMMYTADTRTGSDVNDGSTYPVADSADVIVYQKVPTTGAQTGYKIKHITGKQLSANFTPAASGTATMTISDDGLGAFTSQVNGLTRTSVLAVEYLGTDFDTVMSGLSGSNYYGYITKDAYRTRVNGVDGIQFYVWNGSENVKVFADTSNDTNYVAGTLIGYDGIAADENGNNIMSGLTTLVNGTTVTAQVGSISEVGVGGDDDKIRLTNASSSIIDLGNYDTVLYINSSAKDANAENAQAGVVDGQPVVANALRGVRPTNFIATSDGAVAVIDVNAFVSGPYATVSLSRDINGDGTNDGVQWVDSRNQDNTPSMVYPGALVDLVITVPGAGKLVVNNVISNETNTSNPQYNFTADQAGDEFLIEDLIVTGTTPVSFTWNGTGAGGSDAESAKALNEAMKAAAGSTYEYTGKVPTNDIINVPSGKTLVLKNANMNGANISGNVKVEGALTVAGTNAIAGTLTLDSSAAAVTLFPNAALTANSVVDTAASTNAAKVAELLGYTDNLSVQAATVDNTVTVTGKKLTVAGKLTIGTTLPTATAAEIDAASVDASAVATPSAANIATLFGYADDVTVGTADASSAAIAVGATQILRATSVTYGSNGITVAKGGQVYVGGTELMTDIYDGDITITSATAVTLNSAATLLKSTTITGTLTLSGNQLTVPATMELTLSSITIDDVSDIVGAENAKLITLSSVTNTAAGTPMYDTSNTAAAISDNTTYVWNLAADGGSTAGWLAQP